MSSTIPASLSLPPASRGSEAIAGPVLQVLSGIHRGVRVPIDGSSCTIGAARQADVILADEAVAGEHVRLRFYGRTVAIDAVGGDVAVKGGALVPRGQGCKARMPVEIVFGSVSIVIGQTALSQRLSRRALAWLGLLTLMLIPIVAVQASNQTMDLPTDTVPTHAAAPLGTNSAAMITPVSPPTQSEVAAMLQQRIDAAGLKSLTIQRDGRHFQVSGAVAPADRPAWDAIQRWFDSSQGQGYVLTSLVVAATVAKAPNVKFQAVWFGDNPYVIDAKGERRYPGAALMDGWAIKSIKPGHIVLVRSGEEFALTL